MFSATAMILLFLRRIKLMIEKNAAFRALILISTPKSASKAAKLLEREGVPVSYKMSAMGTAPNEILDMLGLGSTDKTVLLSFSQKSISQKLLQKIGDELRLNATDSGIAFTVALKGMSNLLIKMLEKNSSEETNETNAEEQKIMADPKYSLIAAVVKRGYSNEVMDAARQAGARGGSVVNSRRIADEEICNTWGLGVQEEKEIVLIAAKAETKMEIMQRIGEKCGMHSDAKGVVLSMPIENIVGLM